MRSIFKGALVALIVLAVTAAAGVILFVKTTGLSARATPGSVETAIARRLRAWAVPSDYRELTNPVLPNEESFRSGMAHFADHCATCHSNDGSGDVQVGNGLFPRAPDMRVPATQELTDGELFYIIEHGVRFTGMPAWSTGTIEGEEGSWHLVNFIRRLPDLGEAELMEMQELNPKPPADVRQRLEEERFLRGDDVTPAESDPPSHVH